MSSNNELLKIIEDGYPKFSKGQKKLADYIRQNYDKAAFLTAAKKRLFYPPKLPALRVEADGLSRLWSFYQDHA